MLVNIRGRLLCERFQKFRGRLINVKGTNPSLYKQKILLCPQSVKSNIRKPSIENFWMKVCPWFSWKSSFKRFDNLFSLARWERKQGFVKHFLKRTILVHINYYLQRSSKRGSQLNAPYSTDRRDFVGEKGEGSSWAWDRQLGTFIQL